MPELLARKRFTDLTLQIDKPLGDLVGKNLETYFKKHILREYDDVQGWENVSYNDGVITATLVRAEGVFKNRPQPHRFERMGIKEIGNGINQPDVTACYNLEGVPGKRCRIFIPVNMPLINQLVKHECRSGIMLSSREAEEARDRSVGEIQAERNAMRERELLGRTLNELKAQLPHSYALQFESPQPRRPRATIPESGGPKRPWER
jgi:hypothetical protein